MPAFQEPELPPGTVQRAGGQTNKPRVAMQYDMRPNKDKPRALWRLENLIQPGCSGKDCPELVAGDPSLAGKQGQDISDRCS